MAKSLNILFSSSSGGNVGTLQQVTDLGFTTSNGIKITGLNPNIITGDPGMFLITQNTGTSLVGAIYAYDPNGIITDSALNLVSNKIVGQFNRLELNANGNDSIITGSAKSVRLFGTSGGTNQADIKIGFGNNTSLNNGYLVLQEGNGTVLQGTKVTTSISTGYLYLAVNGKGIELNTSDDAYISAPKGLKIDNTDSSGTPALAILHVGTNNPGPGFPANNPVGYFEGRVRGLPAVNSDEFITLSQLPLSAGGYTAFTADGNIAVLDIVHNLNIDNGNTSDPKRYWPKYFSLTTTEPITNNHLNRVITFPNANTMRLTFALAPNTGENANYVWNIYK